MHRLSLLAAIVPLVLLGTAVPALAHGRIVHAGLPPIVGTVTLAGSTKLQVSTAAGVVTVSLTAATRVIRVVSGSTADLHPNQLVRMHLVPGTSIVDAITIEGMGKVPRSHSTAPRHSPFTTDAATVLIVGPVKHRASANTAPPTRIEGQIVAASATSITVRTDSGKSTYTISGSVTVTKLLTGSLNDLAIGEMVQVLRGRNGNALAVTIMSA